LLLIHTIDPCNYYCHSDVGCSLSNTRLITIEWVSEWHTDLHISVPTDSNLLDMPSIPQPASKLSSALWQWSRKRKESLQLHLSEFEFHFQFPYDSPTTELSDFHQTAQSGNNCKCIQTLKASAKGNNVITNVISANQHFALTFSMQIFKFQRRSCKLLLPLLAPPPECPGELSRRVVW